MIALGVIARGISVGRGSPRRGSRKKRDRWGVVALGVVAGKETEISRAHKNPHKKYRCRNPSNTYTKLPKFSVPSFRRVHVCNRTMLCVRPTDHVKCFRNKSINEHTSFGTTLDSTGRNLISQPESGILLVILF